MEQSLPNISTTLVVYKVTETFLSLTINFNIVKNILALYRDVKYNTNNKLKHFLYAVVIFV